MGVRERNYLFASLRLLRKPLRRQWQPAAREGADAQAEDQHKEWQQPQSTGVPQQLVNKQFDKQFEQQRRLAAAAHIEQQHRIGTLEAELVVLRARFAAPHHQIEEELQQQIKELKNEVAVLQACLDAADIELRETKRAAAREAQARAGLAEHAGAAVATGNTEVRDTEEAFYDPMRDTEEDFYDVEKGLPRDGGESAGEEAAPRFATARTRPAAINVSGKSSASSSPASSGAASSKAVPATAAPGQPPSGSHSKRRQRDLHREEDRAFSLLTAEEKWQLDEERARALGWGSGGIGLEPEPQAAARPNQKRPKQATSSSASGRLPFGKGFQ